LTLYTYINKLAWIDLAVETVNNENRKSICQLGLIQPTCNFPATVAGNGRRYRFQVSKWCCLYSLQQNPKLNIAINSDLIVGLVIISCGVSFGIFLGRPPAFDTFSYRLSNVDVALLQIVVFVFFRVFL